MDNPNLYYVQKVQFLNWQAGKGIQELLDSTQFIFGMTFMDNFINEMREQTQTSQDYLYLPSLFFKMLVNV